MSSTIVNVICSIVIAICAISVMRSSIKVHKITKRQIEYMNKRDGRTSVEETL